MLINVQAHKVGPAIAAGCPFVLKPSDRTPVTAAILGEILASTDLPQGAFSIVPCEVKEAETLSSDDRFKLVSFTGSPTVGWRIHSISPLFPLLPLPRITSFTILDIKATAGKKKVVLELGGNAACVVDDGNAAHVSHAVQRILFGGFYYSGQSCISVQVSLSVFLAFYFPYAPHLSRNSISTEVDYSEFIYMKRSMPT